MSRYTLLFLGVCVILAGLYLGLGGQALPNPPHQPQRVEYHEEYSSGSHEKLPDGYHGPDDQRGTFPTSPPDQKNLQILQNTAYSVGYNNQLKDAAWVKCTLDWSIHGIYRQQRCDDISVFRVY